MSNHAYTTFESYEKLRKTQPDLYYSSTTQRQMRQAQKDMGDAFFTQLEMDFESSASVVGHDH